MDENIKVSQLPSADTITDNDLLMIVQSGENKKATSSQMVDLFEGATQDKYIETTRTSANHFAFTSPREPEEGDVFRVKIATNTDEGNPRLKCNNGNYTIIANDYVALYSKDLSDKYIDVVYASIGGGLHHFKLVEPTSTLQLTNDSGYITKNNIQDDLVNVGTSVDTDYRTNILITKNLLDISTMEIGYIDNSGNIIIGNSDSICSEYIKVNSGSDYTISLNAQYNNIGYALFSSNKTYISRQNNNNKQTLTITIPSGTEYIRVWFNKNGQTITKEILTQNEPQIELGDTRTTYEAFKPNTINVDNNKFSDTINVGTSINPSDRVNVLYSHNLFSGYENGYINSSNGEDETSEGARRSYYIPVKPSTTYIMTTAPVRYIEYSKNKGFIRCTYLNNDNVNYITHQSNTAYVRLGFSSSQSSLDLDTYMYNEGNVLLNYEPYTNTSINVDGQEIYNGNINKYLYDETNTGMKWIDGKPIYRKVINFGYLPNATNKKVSIGYSSSDINIIHLYGTAREYTGYTIAIPHSNTGSITQSVQCEINSNGELYIRTGANYSNLYCYMILEYTKATD